MGSLKISVPIINQEGYYKKIISYYFDALPLPRVGT